MTRKEFVARHADAFTGKLTRAFRFSERLRSDEVGQEMRAAINEVEQWLGRVWDDMERTWKELAKP